MDGHMGLEISKSYSSHCFHSISAKLYENIGYHRRTQTIMKLVNILEMVVNGRAKQIEFWGSGALVEHVWLTLQYSRSRVIWCTCDFSEIRFSIRCVFYTYDSFSTTLFICVPCDSQHKGDFLEFINFKLKNN